MALVVDASVALAWAFPDEHNNFADAVLIIAESEGFHVPALWTNEIANSLAVAYRRQRITPADEQAFLFALSLLKIELEFPVSAVDAIRNGSAAAMRFSLTAYDAAYVDLAARKNLTLAALDKAMRKAAESTGIKLFR